MIAGMSNQLCPHKLNPVACIACYHARASAPPAPRPGEQQYTAAGEKAFQAPPQVQRGVDRALRGFVAQMPGEGALGADGKPVPRGEQAVVPKPETSGKVAVVDGKETSVQQKQHAAPVPPDQQRPLQPEFHAPRPEPGHEYDESGQEKLWEPSKKQGAREMHLIDKLPRHPEAPVRK